ncbi:MAG: methyltransferase domain-containing protein [Dehalococcoidia bacterium]|nr:MAG: methyltransferase domain-containing protein [Dehalococcoidia bacterium]
MQPQQTYQEVTLEDFAQSFGTTVDDIPEDCRDLIAKTDFRYRKFSPRERDKIILDILKTIETGNLTVSGQERKAAWEKGWSENLQNFLESGYKIEGLVPKYIRPEQPVRLKLDYVMPCEPNFEFYYTQVFRLWLFRKYLKDAESIYELGCGTGYNLVLLAELFPEKKLHGLDWTEASQKILNLIAEKHGKNIEAHLFDFYSPDEDLEITDNSAVMTFAALEQIGNNHEAFLQFLLKKSPALCINIECLCELYDENNLLDYLAIKYHKKRNYLYGYLNRLKQLEADGKIEIQEVQRTFFGNLYHEAYSFVVWKPKHNTSSA